MIPSPQVMAERTDSELFETSQFLDGCDLNVGLQLPDVPSTSHADVTNPSEASYPPPYDPRRRLSEQELLIEEPVEDSNVDPDASSISSYTLPPPPEYPPPCPATRTRSRTYGNSNRVHATVTPHDSRSGSVASLAPVAVQRSTDKSYTEVDVLLGRGGKSNNHLGNQLYLSDKNHLQPRYFAATKAEKTAIAQELVEMVHARGGRFVKNEGNDQWREVDHSHARKKSSQSLREVSSKESRAEKRARYKKSPAK